MAATVCPAFEHGVAARPLRGEVESGDLHAVIPRPRGVLVAVADGLGHGYEAAVAARVAMATLTARADLPLSELVKCCHEALLKTRGVAISIASLEWDGNTMCWLAIGNVAAVRLRANGQGNVDREHILMRNGVVGHRLPLLRAATSTLRRGDLLIFATDGVREGFECDTLLDLPPQDIADRILARYGKATDDALVLVGRWYGSPMAGEAL